MGGIGGEARGKSKAKAYAAYSAVAENAEGHGFPDPHPQLNKKLCKQLMQWDPETEEWVLPYTVRK